MMCMMCDSMPILMVSAVGSCFKILCHFTFECLVPCGGCCEQKKKKSGITVHKCLWHIQKPHLRMTVWVRSRIYDVSGWRGFPTGVVQCAHCGCTANSLHLHGCASLPRQYNRTAYVTQDTTPHWGTVYNATFLHVMEVASTCRYHVRKDELTVKSYLSLVPPPFVHQQSPFVVEETELFEQSGPRSVEVS